MTGGHAQALLEYIEAVARRKLTSEITVRALPALEILRQLAEDGRR